VVADGADLPGGDGGVGGGVAIEPGPDVAVGDDLRLREGEGALVAEVGLGDDDGEEEGRRERPSGGGGAAASQDGDGGRRGCWAAAIRSSGWRR